MNLPVVIQGSESMLTKEEIIILRTILLEFEDAEDRQKRLLIPYENVARISDRIEGAVKASGFTEVLDIISNTYGGDFWFTVLGNNQYMQSIDNPEIEVPDELVFYGGDYRYENYVLHDDENEERKFLEDFYILNRRSKSDFFINLRWGLYYKCLGMHESAIKYFEASDQAYHNIIRNSVNEAVKRLYNILTKIYDSDKKILKEPYSPEKHGPFKIEWPPEIFVSIEELPTFHMGEIFLEKGRKCFEEYEQSRNIPVLKDAAEHYSRALAYCENTGKRYCTYFYGQEYKDQSLGELSNHLNILRNFKAFPVTPYQRNSYLEINLLVAKNQLQRIKQERFIASILPLDPDFIEKLKEKIAKEQAEKYESEIKRYKIENEAYKKLGVFSLPGNKDQLLHIIKQARESIFWFDLHFSPDGLDLLEEVKGETGRIRILTTIKTDKLHELRERFKKFKQEIKTDKTRVNIRVICKDKILRNSPHDRFLIIDNHYIYNVPPLTAILSGKYCEIKPTLQMPPIGDLWDQSEDIIEQWNVIKNEFERRLRK